MKLKKLMIAGLLAGVTALPMSSANAFWGGSWAPWNWFDNDYYGPWGGYPGWGYPGYYGGYPGWGYPGYYGGYPGWGGYPHWGGYPGYGGWW